MGDVALPVSHLAGLNRGVVADLTCQVADHIFSGFLNTLLDGASCNGCHCHVRGDLLTVVNKQKRTRSDFDLLWLTTSIGLNREREVHIGLLCIHTMGCAVRTNSRFRAKFNGAFQF